MKIIYGLRRIGDPYRKCVLTTGVFDGVHLGHRAIIKEAVARALKLGRKSTVITFDLGVKKILECPGGRLCSPGVLLSTVEEKIRLIKSLGVDLLCIIKFSKRFSRISAGDFIKELVLSFDPLQIVAGQNHTFGKDGRGNSVLLEKLGRKYGFRSVVLNLRKAAASTTVNSTRIRSLVKKGNVQKANILLGRRFFIEGTVIKGRGVGGKLGFPTANLEVDPVKLVPGSGVYACEIRSGSSSYGGAVNIGLRPTFERSSRSPRKSAKHTVEIHIMGFSGMLYGKKIKVSFIEKVRKERKFRDAETLKRQIELDLIKIKGILGVSQKCHPRKEYSKGGMIW
ncbi:riboflavin biosynthesis protein RibF [Candidatus Desantisbacteria bacterium CG_4_10_14_0_8_um_filter_48_22]|uniref:Riboflavin biosynthesis protein n=1 Tax=Candidatus Desantisbacteria bacterium CG_4_10_14_0_8_um_filter_48_22 TaxID=1974543 RepID=A0A2M7SCH8_9BACT|nr:MAG: riboflavin biosynthesis protein RibF [Candidatus Desantisbacteria bacterium CG1_02_49_89]PIV54387.1 MAG: riboflavin biosynthesis protein RibF [Candidatus Desantisbacteria bacterium CG02_land_8_20_14_3_00_49_13]PIZ17267.1 MAG: riboflavin biosynthesis protein RibF [Candidatus Desantisbacteria bacterium CG_4_10_14_0_8_um_filter_48_22]PJB27637.1 MAG: riboflavin biosynthesis protein RibF [Candidatus Desantisbacteria bacterium CG_4_9_14_3_um_filter_50_7]